MLLIQILGPPVLQHDGRMLPPPPRRALLDVWVYLLLHRHAPLQRDQVAFALWPDTTEAIARANLRRHVHGLGQYLPATSPPWILATAQSLRWNPESPFRLDLDRFDALFERWLAHGATMAPAAAMALLEEATDLCHGELAEGLQADWLEAPRQAVRGRQARMLDQLGMLAALAGRTEAVIAAAERRLQSDRSSEPAHRLLAWARHAAGDRSGALRQIEACRAILREDLDADATPVLASLQAAVHAGWPPADVLALALADGEGSPPAAASSSAPTTSSAIGRRPAPDPRDDRRAEPDPSRGNLPATITPLVGRDADIAALVDHLASQPLVTLVGLGGMGKTCLALAVAQRLEPRFRDGVWWIDVAALNDPSLVAYELAILLGVRARSSAGLADALVEALAPCAALVVLDGCERLVEPCAELARAIADHCPRVRVVATSTERLRVAGEQVWAVQPLGFPTAAQAAELPATALAELPAVRLFLARAAKLHRPLPMDAETLRTVAEICRRLDGMPLAIELAAGRTQALSPHEIAARLDDSLGLLHDRGGDGREIALRSTIAWSFDLLDAPDRALLGALAVFEGGCDLAAAEAVAGAVGLSSSGAAGTAAGRPALGAPGAVVLDGLTRLIDRSLVTVRTTDDGGTRYGMLEAVRQLGRHEVEAAGLAAALRERHAAHFADLAAEASPELLGDAAGPWRARLEADNDNLRAALRWALDGGARATGLRLGAGLWRFWYLRGALDEGAAWLARLAAAGEAVAPSTDGAEVLRGAGVLAAAHNRGAEARAWFDRSLAQFQALGDRAGSVAVLDHLAALLRDASEHEAAAAYAEQSLKLKQAGGDRAGTAVTLRLLAEIDGQRGDHAAARRRYLASLDLLRTVRARPYDLAQTLLGYGGVLLEDGDVEAAEPHLEEALVGFRGLRDHTNTARCMSLLGTLELTREHYAQACQHYAECMAWSRRHGHEQLALWQLYNLGLAYRDWGKLEAAERFAQEALEAARAQDDTLCVVRALGLLVDVAVARGDALTARVHAREMRAHAAALEHGLALALAFAAGAAAAMAGGDLDQARAYLRDELAVTGELGDPYYRLEALDRWVVFLAQAGEAARAVEVLAAVDEQRRQRRMPRQAYYRRQLEAPVAEARAALGAAASAAAERRGRGMALPAVAALLVEG